MRKQAEDLLRGRDVAHLLDCSPDDAIVMAQTGKLLAEKRGRRWLYNRKSVMVLRNRMQRGKA